MKRTRRSGGVMALYAAFIGLVGVPLMALTVDGTRIWLKKAELANAVEAACSAYANTPDMQAFQDGQGVRLAPEARSEGIRLFSYNIPEGGSLTNMAYTVEDKGPFLKMVTATCTGRASVRLMLTGGSISINLVNTVTVKAKFGTTSNWIIGG
ncbi:MAG: hypothetical protein JW748_03245 [Anaerolineales bacterium]|nr:hypothetical protein [Anaerolineales bacterium]